jgi:ParB family transcriptional regulator, chromosome partitioning protein
MSGTLQHLDPATLVIGDNVRDSAALVPQFVASIAEHGVLQPITAVRTDDGIEVRDGQRRTLAAREAGLASIPVYVLDEAKANTKAATAERIVQQIVANDHREALTDAQRATGINQMLLAGVTAIKVAKALSVDRGTVTAAKDVADSPTALEALRSRQLSLIKAAALREFEGDERAVSALKSVAGTASFDHRVAQLRQERLADAARAEAESTYAERGFTILDERPGWRDTATVLLSHLRTADGAVATDAVVTDPALWTVFMIEETVITDAATGEPIDDDEVDWNTEHHPSREPADGLRHADSVMEKVVWQPEYYCRDPRACGLTLAQFLTRAKPVIAGNHHTDNDDAAAHAEDTRAQRRKVLTLNKLGAAAQEVRRTWVREHLLARKTPVKGAAVFVATCLEAAPGLPADYAGQQVIGELLGLGDGTLEAAIQKLAPSADARAQVLVLGMVLAALEGRTPKDAWRHAEATWTPKPGPAEYLRFLAANGYTLSAIERVITGEREADAVHAELAQHK